MSSPAWPQRLNRFRYAQLAIVLLLATPLLQVVAEARAPAPLWRALLTLVAISALLAVCTSQRQAIVAAILGVPWVYSQWDWALTTDETLAATANFAGMPFFAYVVVRVFAVVYRPGEVDRERLFAAVAGYALLVWAFATFYEQMLFFDPGALGVKQPADVTQLDLVAVATYFSVVTQTTLGYGDFTPAPGWPRALAMLQPMLGTFYLAVTIARLVGVRSSESRVG